MDKPILDTLYDVITEYHALLEGYRMANPKAYPESLRNKGLQAIHALNTCQDKIKKFPPEYTEKAKEFANQMLFPDKG